MIEIKILRRRTEEKKGYWQSFAYEPETKEDTVATALRALEKRDPLTDINGVAVLPVKWECNCLQKKCGACAMVIDGKPQLACGVRLADCKRRVALEPLKKFPLVEDLLVDRSCMFENLKQIRLWFEDPAKTPDQTAGVAYEASRCLQCGCCLEVCPNFVPHGKFMGMAAGMPMARLLAKLPESQQKEAAKLYSRHVFEGCEKSLACRDVCPAKISIDDLLVNSNAVAVWKRFVK